MTQTENAPVPIPPVEEMQRGWTEMASRLGQLEAETKLIEQENKALRQLLDRVIDHRQKSHGELILLLTSLVSKLPLNDVGVIVSRLVEHHNNVSHYLAALSKGTVDAEMAQPALLKTFDQTKRELLLAIKPLAEELLKLDSPLEPDLLQAIPQDPDVFFSPRMVRANRCFLKGQVPRERVVRQFGEQALPFFYDLTTDPKLNPHPKADEIVLGFRSDFEEVFRQYPQALPEKRDELMALYQRVQKSKGHGEAARAQRSAFQKLSFFVELLHYYENQSTEAPDVLFAQRLPALIEQLVIANPNEPLDENLIVQAENLLGHILNTDHRHMVVNNIGKGSDMGKTLKFVLRLRSEAVSAADQTMPDFLRHIIPSPSARPDPKTLANILRLFPREMQKLVLKSIAIYEKLRREDALALVHGASKILEITGIVEAIKAQELISPEVERQMAWNKVKDLLSRRADPAAVAAAMRDRLHSKYDGDEIRQSWLVLIESDPMSLIRVFSQLPYLQDGSTDPIARTLLETYVTRLSHEKYAATYHKVVTSLKNMFRAKPDSPTLVNFLALVRWVDKDVANRLAQDIGMPVHA